MNLAIGRAQVLNFRNPYFISGDAGPTGMGGRGVSPVGAGRGAADRGSAWVRRAAIMLSDLSESATPT
jgi:hypothetical protein